MLAELVLAVFRGTQNGTTVMKMVEKHGAIALTGEHSILGYLASKGINVSPTNTPPGTPPETSGFSGGYIVRTYGSHRTNGVDAIQLEFGGAVPSRGHQGLHGEVSRAEAVTRAGGFQLPSVWNSRTRRAWPGHPQRGDCKSPAPVPLRTQFPLPARAFCR